jgi:hypothetical protein
MHVLVRLFALIISLAVFTTGCGGAQADKPVTPAKTAPEKTATQKTKAPKELTLQDVLAKTLEQAGRQRGFTYSEDGYVKRTLKRANIAVEFQIDYRLQKQYIHEPFTYRETGTLIDPKKKKLKEETVVKGNWIYSHVIGKSWKKSKLNSIQKTVVPTHSLQTVVSAIKTQQQAIPSGLQMEQEGNFYVVKVTRPFVDTSSPFRSFLVKRVLYETKEDQKGIRKAGGSPNTKQLKFTVFTQEYKIDKTTFNIVDFKEDLAVLIPAGKFSFSFQVYTHSVYSGTFQGTITAPVK